MTETNTNPARVLVVDDNQDAATSLGFLLAAAGYRVETCFDGESALAAAELFRPHACVLDINMPGMDGYELARLLREKPTDRLPVLVTVTGYDDDGHLDRVAAVGFDLHFAKPVNPVDLTAQLGDCVRP